MKINKESPSSRLTSKVPGDTQNAELNEWIQVQRGLESKFLTTIRNILRTELMGYTENVSAFGKEIPQDLLNHIKKDEFSVKCDPKLGQGFFQYNGKDTFVVELCFDSNLPVSGIVLIVTGETRDNIKRLGLELSRTNKQ